MLHNPSSMQFEVASWTTALKASSSLGTLVLLGVSYALYRAIPYGTRVPFAETFGTVLILLPPVIFLIALFFVVRGYALDASTLYVQRLFWKTRIPLDGIHRAWHDSSAMCRSLRIFGNGGLFSVTGLFQNATLGRYRAFVTDSKQAVVLDFRSKVIVVSPAYPRLFLAYLNSIHPEAVVGEPPKAP